MPNRITLREQAKTALGVLRQVRQDSLTQPLLLETQSPTVILPVIHTTQKTDPTLMDLLTVFANAEIWVRLKTTGNRLIFAITLVDGKINARLLIQPKVTELQVNCFETKPWVGVEPNFEKEIALKDITFQQFERADWYELVEFTRLFLGQLDESGAMHLEFNFAFDQRR